MSLHQNMGFSEVPDDAFDTFDLNFPDPPQLFRTYKAHCPLCKTRTETTNPNNRLVVCGHCNSQVILVQQCFHGFIVRKHLRILRKRELMYRWFFTYGINGGDLSRRIGEFL